MVPKELLQEAYRTFNVRDIDGALSLMQQNVEWPNGMEGGYVYGKDEIRAYWTRQWKTYDPHVEPLKFETADNGKVLVAVHQVIKDIQGNLLFDRMVNHIYTIEDGLIKKMEIEEDKS